MLIYSLHRSTLLIGSIRVVSASRRGGSSQFKKGVTHALLQHGSPARGGVPERGFVDAFCRRFGRRGPSVSFRIPIRRQGRKGARRGRHRHRCLHHQALDGGNGGQSVHATGQEQWGRQRIGAAVHQQGLAAVHRGQQGVVA